MIKLYFLFLTTSSISLFACNSSPKTHAVKPKLDSLQYSAYLWRINQQTSDLELLLAYYIYVCKDGSYSAMRHNTTPESAIYFKGEIDRSVKHLLDSLAIVSLDTLYIKPELRIYDGNTFQLSFTTSGKHNIDFYQNDAPPYLQRVAKVLDTVIFQSSETAAQFNLSFHEQVLKRHSLQKLGELPRMEVPKFK